MQPTVTAWWGCHDSLVALAHWMAGHGYTASAVAHMVEKPWRYSAEWAEMKEEDDE